MKIEIPFKQVRRGERFRWGNNDYIRLLRNAVLPSFGSGFPTPPVTAVCISDGECMNLDVSETVQVKRR